MRRVFFYSFFSHASPVFTFRTLLFILGCVFFRIPTSSRICPNLFFLVFPFFRVGPPHFLAQEHPSGRWAGTLQEKRDEKKKRCSLTGVSGASTNPHSHARIRWQLVGCGSSGQWSLYVFPPPGQKNVHTPPPSTTLRPAGSTGKRGSLSHTHTVEVPMVQGWYLASGE